MSEHSADGTVESHTERYRSHEGVRSEEDERWYQVLLAEAREEYRRD